MSIDTNAAQFARLGNPWVSERDRMDLGNSPVSRGKARQNRNLTGRGNPNFQDAKPVARVLLPEELRAQKHRDNLRHIRNLSKAAKGQIVRETTGYAPTVMPARIIKPIAQTEMLDPMSHAHFVAESLRLDRKTAKAVDDVKAVQLDRMAKALKAYDKKMSKALAA